MIHIRKILFLLFFVPSVYIAQVPKNVIVEHFTNTRCSICASKNPGFYSNLNSQSGILHLAIHPSSPYSNCLLNNHRPTENDGRTNYYGVYGSTPRFVIQGEVLSGSTNMNQASVFTPYLGKTSPAQITMTLQKFSTDSVTCRVIIKTVQNHSLGGLKLFVALAEDVVSYASPNGETMHFDVFRKALTSVSGNAQTLPVGVGDSIELSYSAPSDVDWDINRIYAVAILQEDGNKKVVQSSATTKSGRPLGLEKGQMHGLRIYPNPGNGLLHIEGNVPGRSYIDIYNLSGALVRTVVTTDLHKQTLDLSDLDKGIYMVQLKSDKGRIQQRIVLQ